jgi:putative sterol carrier protein
MFVSMTADTYEDITSGKVQAPQAFMMGQVRIEGDMSIGMRLASLAMSAGAG